MALGTGYIVTGQPPRRPRPRRESGGFRAVLAASRPRQAGVRSALPRPGSTERHASNSAGANNCGALTQAP